ncbi:MAG: hypothetical protein JW795_05350 [Chitinivibrionales bacterium]|nr:hypothetical protein [Chitinivibrionales bacterium]
MLNRTLTMLLSNLMSNIQWVFLFLTPLIVSLAFIPVVIRLAQKLYLVDRPNFRSVHKKPIPRLGGLVFVIGFFCTVLVMIVYRPQVLNNNEMILFGGFIIFVIGLLDDFLHLSPKWKFLTEGIVALMLVFGGVYFEWMTNPFNGNTVYLGPIIGGILSFFWIVGVCNSINLIDGLDGLAAGVSFIALFTMTIIALFNGNAEICFFSIPLIGAVLGFLRYNFFPARIFMGDSGSLFLGYMLAVLSIKNVSISSTAAGILIPIVVLGLPIFDTLFSMARRILTGKKIFQPDKQHVHHQILARGFTHKQTVLILYSIMFVFCAISFCMVLVQNRVLAGLLALYPLGVLMLIGRLGYLPSILAYRYKFEQRMRRAAYVYDFKSKKLSLMSRAFRYFSNNSKILAVFDSIMIFTAWAAARWINRYPDHLPWIGCLLLLSLWFIFSLIWNCYSHIWRYIEFNSLGGCLKAITMSVLFTFIIAGTVKTSTMSITEAVLLWMLSIGALFSIRLSHNYYFNFVKRQLTDFKKGPRVAIFGAGDTGELISGFLAKNDLMKYDVVGFIDDDPLKLGKTIHGRKVLGTVYSLAAVHEKTPFDILILSTIPTRRRKRVLLFEKARRLGVRVVEFRMELRNVQQRFNKEIGFVYFETPEIRKQPEHPLEKTTRGDEAFRDSH